MVSQVTALPNGLSVGGGVVGAGPPMQNTLRVAANVAESETVVIGTDTWEVSLLNDDTTDNTANGDFNNTRNPLIINRFAFRYPGTNRAPGNLIRIENEIMEVVAYYATGDQAHLKRGVSGTTNAAHADALDIFEDANVVTAGRKATGLNATLTPTAFLDALVADINNRGTEPVKATKVSANEMFIESADRPGGSPAGSTSALATTETLGGANNVWAAATMSGGKQFSAPMAYNYTVTTEDATIGRVRLPFPFTPTGFLVQVYDANGLQKNALTDQFIISGNAVILDGTGATNPVATDKVHCIAWA